MVKVLLAFLAGFFFAALLGVWLEATGYVPPQRPKRADDE